MKVQSAWGFALAAAAMLGACGGDSDSSAPAPAPSSITISGTAAKGAALAGATVRVICATGTAPPPTATTSSAGAYTLTMVGARLPCVLRAVGSEGSTFHSLVGGTGDSGSFVANITPLTEMVFAAATAAYPEHYYQSFGWRSRVSAAQVDAGVAYVEAALAPVTSLAGINPLTDALLVDNLLDQKIDAVVSGLAATGLSVQQADFIIEGNPATPEVLARALQPSAASCTALKSGKYRMINPTETDPARKDQVLTVNAVALTATAADGTAIPFIANGDCKFTIDSTDETNTVLVSPGGVLVVYGQSKADASSRWVTIGLPEQTQPVSKLDGTWNLLDWDPNSGSSIAGYVGSVDQATFDASGQVTARSRCLGLAAACDSASAPLPRVAAAVGGGFELFEGGAKIGRAFLSKVLSGGGGWLVFVAVTDDGGFIVGSRQESLADDAYDLLPVGWVDNYRDFTLNGDGSLSDLLDETNTVTAVDGNAFAVTHVRTRDNRLDTITYDKPRYGLRYRAQNSCTSNVTGTAINCAEIVQMPLEGGGITLSMAVGTSPANAFLSVSVSKP